MSENLSWPLLDAPALDPRLVARWLKPGRVSDTGMRVLDGILRDPMTASTQLRQANRNVRYLHSAERRAVFDAIRDILRLQRILTMGVSPKAHASASLWWCWGVQLGVDISDAEALWNAADWGAVPRLAEVNHRFASLRTLHPHQVDTTTMHEMAGVPDGIFDGLFADLGLELWDFLWASAQRAPLVVRVDRRTSSTDAVASALRQTGIDVQPSALSPAALRLPTGTNLRALPQGIARHLDPQDDASQLIAELVDLPAGAHVVDWCAGAGGKTLALAMRRPDLRLSAGDIRKPALRELARRALSWQVNVSQYDWRDAAALQRLPPADTIVVDLPCSGTGVWRRHPEWRLRLGSLDIRSLMKTQHEILEAALRHLAVGGEMILSTCSVRPEEGRSLVEALCQRHPDLTVVPVAQRAPWLPSTAMAGAFLQTWPQRHGSDGFFAAIVKKGETGR